MCVLRQNENRRKEVRKCGSCFQYSGRSRGKARGPPLGTPKNHYHLKGYLFNK